MTREVEPNSTIATDDAVALRRNLSEMLCLADPEEFIIALWAVNALQTGRSAAARWLLSDVPEDAASDGILGPHAIYPWELETLANEMLAQPLARHRHVTAFRRWPVLTTVINSLRLAESAEYSAGPNSRNVLRELGRISARQFEWQRGFTTTAEFYRSVYMYGQGASAEYLAATHGVTVADMTLVGYALMAGLLELPVLRPRKELAVLHGLGVSRDALAKVLARIAAPVAQVAAEARSLRGDGLIAYAPSILRRYPCLLMGAGSRRLRAPLPALIVERVTSGLFYDVIGGGGPVRAECGRRFEEYALRLFDALLPQMPLEREWTYRAAGSTVATPDLIGKPTDGNVDIVIECKAARMNIAARFGADPVDERGYAEMAKGVLQLWRFVAHSRRGLTGRAIAADARLAIVSLDDWFMTRGQLIAEVVRRAHLQADEAGIEPHDRRSVAFISIGDLELVLRRATRATFLAAVEQAALPERHGWLFSALHDDLAGRQGTRKSYPFDDDLERLLPWWRLLRQHRDVHALSTE